MISNDNPKMNKKLIIISVIVLTILTLNVSYSAFFDVQTQTGINTFTAGTLSVTVNQKTQMLEVSILPTATNSLPSAENTQIDPNWKYSEITLTNDGDLDADFMVTIGYGSDGIASERLPMQYLKIGVHDEESNKWLKFGDSSYYVTLSSLTPLSGQGDVYPIIRDTLSSSNLSKQKNYKIFIWLSEDTPITEINKKVNLKINVRSTTTQGQNGENGQQNVTVSQS